MTVTTTTSQAEFLATEAISEVILWPQIAKEVVTPLYHHDTSLDGANTGTRNYTAHGSVSAMSAGTEGTALTPAEFADGTTVASSPAEIAQAAEITLELLHKRNPGRRWSSVMEVFDRGDVNALVNVASDIAARMVKSASLKRETDALALFSGISNGVGSTGTALTVRNLVQAKLQLHAQDPANYRGIFALCNKAVDQVNDDALTSSGGLGATLFSQQADFSAINIALNPDASMGTFLQDPVVMVAKGVEPTSGGDCLSAYFVPGYMRPPGVDMEDQGFAVFNEQVPPTFLFDRYGLNRAVYLVFTHFYDFAEIQDGHAVKITSVNS